MKRKSRGDFLLLDAATAALAAQAADRYNAPTYDDRVRALRARYQHGFAEPAHDPAAPPPRAMTRFWRIFQPKGI
jgi:hypothetical protein